MKYEHRLNDLHPLGINQFRDLYRDLHDAGLHFHPFETVRSPADQEAKKAAGVSQVGAWRSVHQYGLAVDFVWNDGKWSWSNQHPWDELSKRAVSNGLFQPIKWDRPHIVLAGWRAKLSAWLATQQFT